MIDITKPLELEDGRSFVFQRRTYYDGKLCIGGLVEGCPNYKMFHPETGRHIYDKFPNLRNKIMKLVDVNKPVTVDGIEAKIIHVFENGNLAVVVEGWGEVQTYDKYGSGKLVNAVKVEVRYCWLWDHSPGKLYYMSSEDAKKMAPDHEGRAILMKITFEEDKPIKAEQVDG